MANVFFKCPGCSTHLASDVGSVGGSLTCTVCGQRVVVPKPSVLFQCHKCQSELSAPSEEVGESFYCPNCEAYLAIPKPVKAVGKAKPPLEKKAIAGRDSSAPRLAPAKTDSAAGAIPELPPGFQPFRKPTDEQLRAAEAALAKVRGVNSRPSNDGAAKRSQESAPLDTDNAQPPWRDALLAGLDSGLLAQPWRVDRVLHSFIPRDILVECKRHIKEVSLSYIGFHTVKKDEEFLPLTMLVKKRSEIPYAVLIAQKAVILVGLVGERGNQYAAMERASREWGQKTWWERTFGPGPSPKKDDTLRNDAWVDSHGAGREHFGDRRTWRHPATIIAGSDLLAKLVETAKTGFPETDGEGNVSYSECHWSPMQYADLLNAVHERLLALVRQALNAGP